MRVRCLFELCRTRGSRENFMDSQKLTSLIVNLTHLSTPQPQCACLCNCAEGGLALCHAYRVRKMRTKGRGRRSAAAAAAASGSMSAEATSPSKARGETDEVRQPFGNARGGPPSGPSDADTNSDVRVNAFGSSTAAGSDGPSTQADPNNYETQLWALGLLGVGDENGAGENEEREGSAHSEIGYEALMGDGPIQPVPELQNELLQLLQHKKRARANEPKGRRRDRRRLPGILGLQLLEEPTLRWRCCNLPPFAEPTKEGRGGGRAHLRARPPVTSSRPI